MKEFVRFFSSRVDTGCTDFVVIVLALCVVQIYGTDGLSTDGLALLDFKNGLISKNILESWNASDVSPCNWEGVVCSGSDGLVTSLLLFNAGLYGSISPSLGKLQGLKHLNLSQQYYLFGDIPLELGNCSDLTTLALENNCLSGSIPITLGKLQALKYLKLSANILTGEIPVELGSCTKLTTLALDNNMLDGSIPAAIGKLQALQNLDLSTNKLAGEIPGELGSCTKLTTLALGNNMLDGSIPAAIGKLQALQNLDLSTNNLTGEIPGELGSCTKLTTLALGNNMLDGSIPAAIGKLQALQNLDLSTNNLTGEIPGELGSCTKLTTLALGNNMLDGSIPAAIGKLQALQNLDLSTNNLTGEIPGELASCTNLKVLKIQSNQLTGSIPPGIYNISNLSGFYINNNNLTGNITEGLECLAMLPNVYDIWMQYNFFSGTIPVAIKQASALERLFLGFQSYGDGSFGGVVPKELGELPNLVDLDIHGNNFIGIIPPELASISSLETLNLSSNKLTGLIPPELGNLINLVYLNLAQNKLTGPLPAELGYLTNLTELDLHNNKLNGTIPPSLATLSNLSSFDVHGNSISGSIPELFNCLYLSYFDMSDNELSGQMIIPISFTFLQFLNLSYNHFVGPIPLFLFEQSMLITVDLSYNFLNGSNSAIFASGSNEYKACAPSLQELYLQGNSLSEQDLSIYTLLNGLPVLNTLNLAQNDLKGLIPQEIGLLNASLVMLNLSWNQFSGTIPTTLGSLLALQVLDLSHNQLSGTILPSLGTQLFSLKSINVSYNHLDGSLPSSWVRFLVANYDSFIGNPGLCLKYSSHNQCIKNVNVNIRIMIIVMSCVVFIVGLSIFTCCYIRRRSKSTLVVPNDMEILSALGREISFNNIMEATQNLSDDYIIGKGGQGIVYKAVLHNGNVVAVKKIPLLNKDIKIHKSFLREINTIGNIKHRNLVKLLGFCKFGKIALVVYNYFPNGDLFDAIHNKERGIVLDWDTRLKIVEGIAHGLAYLHHYCVPPIIHRDIKSKNVLLDVDMEAHITDFGIAKAIALKPNEDYVNTTITIQGTYGYIAPENGYETQVTPKVDVYSFGVLLLELLTGKQPLDPSFGEFEHIVPWVLATMKQNGPNLNDDVFDSTLLDTATDIQKEQMFQVLKIAIVCTKDIPSERLTMTHVLEILGMSRVIACSPLCN